ncbi:GNAT family N-acetyltransferase [Paraliomyxa miuraensis]|uniref:GNAT family N-acetyltransferase n=1 Tax=Paraliomyxa miuraensis TaxID=376150 RepID=UPI002259091F|nr:GNAT family N-acetyltransferase [Paraliomyxa miuraensis]MCX4244298.1 GNAT family N-acetyltransferase [Paraliomyxa miuraensis]
MPAAPKQQWRVIEVPADQRQAYQDLLRLADDSDREIASYRELGALFGLVDADGEPKGEALVLPTEERHTMELRSLAIEDAFQGRGLGRRLVQDVLERLRAAGMRRVVVGTASSSLDALAFYLRLGFRPWRIERDRFTEARGYPPGLCEDGIEVRDMIWLDCTLE